MKSFHSVTLFAGLVCSSLIKTPSGSFALQVPSRLNTIHIATDYNPNNIANAATWTKYAQKGGALRCLLDMTDEQAGKHWPDPLKRIPTSASSEWKGTLQGHLLTWYWHETAYHQGHHCDFSDNGIGYNRIGVALAALGLDAKPVTSGGKNQGYSVEHFDPEEEYEDGEQVPADDQMYPVGRDTYTATGGHYRFVINAEQGALFVQSLNAPRYSAAQQWDHTPQSNELPHLQFASDILAGYWLRTPNPKNLEYYFANNVVNEETLPLINKVLGDRGHDKIPAWPGVRVSGPSEEGAVLLGSPIGSNLAFLLLQHKTELGNKRISDTTIFRDYKANPAFQADIQLLFRIEDVADGDMLPEDTEMVDVTTDASVEVDEGQGAKRRDSVLHEDDLRRHVRRVHEVSINERGSTVVSSHGFERV